MKRFLCLTIVLCVCLSCAVFASCDFAPEPEQTQADDTGTDNRESQTENQTEKATEKANDSATLKAIFEQALSFKDVSSVTLKLTTAHKDDVFDGESVATIFFDGDKSKTLNSEKVVTAYAEKDGEKKYGYALIEDTWTRYEIGGDSPAAFYTLSDYVDDFKYVDYDSFEYDGEVYTRIEQSSDSYERVIIKIDGTRLVYAEHTVRNQSFDYTRKYEFSDYGTTTVEIPSDYVEAVTE